VASKSIPWSRLGAEFVVIFAGCDDLALLDRIALRIITRLEEPISYAGETCRLSASIGTTVSSFYALPLAGQMLSDADEATYASKHAGRGQHTVFAADPPGGDGGCNQPNGSSDGSGPIHAPGRSSGIGASAAAPPEP